MANGDPRHYPPPPPPRPFRHAQLLVWLSIGQRVRTPTPTLLVEGSVQYRIDCITCSRACTRFLWVILKGYFSKRVQIVP